MTYISLFYPQGIEAQPTAAQFLQSSKQEHQKLMQQSPNQIPKMHFVMGNESADLDSIISSIAYAYYLNQDMNEGKGQLYFPVLNIRREDLTLRKDALYLFQILGLSPQNLLFLDDVSFDPLFAQNKLRLTLVDHNLLRPSQEYLSPAVERIIDHHVDENKNYPLLDQKNKLIAEVGSATTLVAEKMLASQQIKMTPELSALLLAPILLDTLNLQSKDKTTDRDRKVVEILLPIALKIAPSDFYEKLIAAKTDISNLTPAMLLSKDFKEYLDGNLLYGIAAPPITISWWIEDEQMILPVLEKFASDRHLAFLIVLMANQEPTGPKRKIIIYSPSSRLLSSLKRYIKEDRVLNEILIPGPISQNERIAYYTTIPFIARKQLQPLFHFSQRLDLMTIFKEEKDKKDRHSLNQF